MLDEELARVLTLNLNWDRQVGFFNYFYLFIEGQGVKITRGSEKCAKEGRRFGAFHMRREHAADKK